MVGNPDRATIRGVGQPMSHPLWQTARMNDEIWSMRGGSKTKIPGSMVAIKAEVPREPTAGPMGVQRATVPPVPPVPPCPTQKGALSHLASHCSPGVSHRKYLQSHLVPPPFFFVGEEGGGFNGKGTGGWRKSRKCALKTRYVRLFETFLFSQ